MEKNEDRVGDNIDGNNGGRDNLDDSNNGRGNRTEEGGKEHNKFRRK